MKSINLLQRQAGDSPAFLRIKRATYLASSVVLIITIVGMSAFTGWWLYLSQRRGVSTQEVINLTKQISALASAEVLARQIEYRSTVIQTSLANRVDTARATEIVAAPYPEIVVVSWDFDSQNIINSLVVTSPAPAAIEKYAADLVTSFKSSTISSMAFSPDTGWSATIKLGQLK